MKLPTKVVGIVGRVSRGSGLTCTMNGGATSVAKLIVMLTKVTVV